MYTMNYYVTNNENEDNFKFIRKILADYEIIKCKIKFTNNFKLTLSEIYYENLPDIIKYESITRVRPSDFLWVNDIVNSVSNNFAKHFCRLMLKVLIAKHSVEKIIDDSYNYQNIIE